MFSSPLAVVALALDNGLLSTIFGAAALVAAALAGLTWGTVKTLREGGADLRSRVDDLEKEQARDKAKIAELESENAALGRLVTGEVHWTALTDLLNVHHSEARAHWDDVLLILRRIEARGGPPHD